MKRGSLSLCFAAMLFMGQPWPLHAQGQETNGPKAVIEERVFDAKKVTEGEIIEHTFKLSNTGDKTLFVHNINTP